MRAGRCMAGKGAHSADKESPVGLLGGLKVTTGAAL